MPNPIVVVTVSQQIPPTAVTLQQTGAFLSQGATTTAPGTLSLLPQPSSLAQILTGQKSISVISWSSPTVTVTAAAPHGFTIGDTLTLTISGVSPAGYNGTYTCTVTTATQFTYTLASYPGSPTVLGFYTPEDVAELTAMNATFFAQGVATSAYVLELGPGNVNDGVAYLTTWLANNPFTVYTFCTPRAWDANAAFLALAADYQSPTSLLYFFVTTTPSTYTAYTTLMKDIDWNIEAPGIPSTEFDAAARMYQVVSQTPSNLYRVPPFAYRFLYGVTPYPTVGNATLLTQIVAAGGNYVGTGYQGGISTAIDYIGQTADKNGFLYWYSIDWMQINLQLWVTNAIINGSNNTLNPLYYNQPGIDSLQATIANYVVQNGISFGLVTGTMTLTELDGVTLDQNLNAGVYANQAVVNAVPFVTYAGDNPSDFKEGIYRGFAVVYIPAQGFLMVQINVLVTEFVNL
jgi:hypothetical protein